MQVPSASVHWYGKAEVALQRKIGHITITAPDRATAVRRLASIDSEAATALSSSAGDPECRLISVWFACCRVLSDKCGGVPHVGGPLANISISTHLNKTCMKVVSAPETQLMPIKCVCADEGNSGKSSAQVGIIMGSDSDLATMKAAAEVLRDFNVQCEVTVVSAHRTPDRMLEYARTAHERGIKVRHTS